MAAYADIILALLNRAATLSVGSPALPISMPEPTTTFVPPNSGKYLIAEVFTNRPRWEGLSAGRMDQGLLQITVVWPKGKGLIAPAAAVDAVLAHFPKGHVMRQGSAGVKVVNATYPTSPIIASDARWPITISWAA